MPPHPDLFIVFVRDFQEWSQRARFTVTDVSQESETKRETEAR